jgi:hypothetical protein
MVLPEVLTSATTIGAEVSVALRSSESIANLGVKILGLAVISIKPTPEMAKALEAGAREALPHPYLELPLIVESILFWNRFGATLAASTMWLLHHITSLCLRHNASVDSLGF